MSNGSIDGDLPLPRVGVIGAVLLAFLAGQFCTRADTGAPGAESWIRAVAATGGVANLALQFPEHSQRHIQSRTLEELLTDTNAIVHRHGICIENAVFDDPIDLISARVDHEVCVGNSVFLGPVDLSGSHFTRGLLLRGCFFATNLVCSRLRVDGSLDFASREILVLKPMRQAEFESPAVLLARLQKELEQRGIMVGQGSRIWSQSTNAWFLLDPQNHLLLSLAWKSNTARVKRVSYFGGSFNEMKDMQIGQHLKLSEAFFAGELQMNSLRVGGTVSLQFATFQGVTSFGYARITDEFNGEGAYFQNGSADFYGMRTEGQINLGNARFGGDVDFSEAKAGALGVWGSVFEGLTDFRRVSILSDFNAEAAVFSSSSDVAFNGLKVLGNADFSKAIFTGKVHFASCTINGELYAKETKFFDDVDFDGLRVNGGAVFPHSLFNRSVSFKNATLNRFEVEDVKWPDGADRVHLEGLSYGRIRAVREDSEHEQTWERLNERLSKSEVLSADVYEHLEEFFRREGKPDLADKVYIAHQRQERRKVLWPNLEMAALKQGDLIQTIFASWSLGSSYVRDWCTGYGKRPWQALIPSLIIVLVGCLAFPVGVMEHNSIRKRDTDEKAKSNADKHKQPHGAVTKYLFHAPPYNRLAYSLDLFIPVLHLHYDEAWVPSAEAPGWVHVWMFLQTFLGWILVPLFLAASSGLVH